MTPKVSIIMPVFNTAAFLADTLCQLKKQTLQDFEVICVDDDSTDHSLSILQKAAEQDQRIIVLHQPHKGAGTARNLGFSHARGEYVIFLDSDDQFLPMLLEKLYAAITEAQADIAACNFSCIDVNGKETRQEGVHIGWIPNGLKVFSYRDTPDYIMRVVHPTPWNKLYRAAFLREKGLKYDEISSTNDIAFAAVSVAAAERVVRVPDSLVRYRIGHAGTITSGKSGKLNNVKTAVFSAVRQARELPHSDMIRNSILSFIVGNFVFSLSKYIDDFSDPGAAEFYQMVHETFNREEFANVDPRILANPKQYLDFCTVRKHDYESMKKLIGRRLIVSLTTYPKRIGLIPQVLESLYEQTRTPDEIILWLASEQFPEGETALPERLLELKEQGKLAIRWCDDLKAHKKYFFAMQEYPEDLIVTVDDDLTYSRNTLSSLYSGYLLYPEAVSTVRAHLIMLDENRQIMPYQSWIQETDACIHEPSMQLMATGGAGVLYPPHLFRKEFFDPQAIMENSPYADDLWLKAMQLASDVPVVVVRPHEQLRYLPGSQEDALCLINVQQNQNDVQLENIIRWMDRTLEPGLFMRGLTGSSVGTRILGIEQVSRHLDTERKTFRRKFNIADGKNKQLDAKIRQADKSRMDESAKRKAAEEQLKQTRQELLQVRNQLKKTEDDRKQQEAQFKQQRDRIQQQLDTKQQQMNTTQQQLNAARQQLAQTRAQLRETQESKPVGRQLKAVGTMLAQQKAAGANPIGLGFKYLVYGLAWIPEKLLAGAMFYLKNGGKQTVKKLFGRISGKK
jgi:glycosyltransferase involved in cell wall biosynthesis